LTVSVITALSGLFCRLKSVAIDRQWQVTGHLFSDGKNLVCFQYSSKRAL
jgi:hypothetical protein